jgi:4-alpha-glucanotransferase
MENQLEQFDWLRIDHFRGLESSWEIPQEEETAINGHWIKVPGFELLTTLSETFEHLPFIAEDLGVVTDEVEHLRDEFDLPGMKILQFAFNNDHENPYLPKNHVENCVVYTGTHDNNTTLGWYQSLSEEEQNTVKSQLETSGEDIVDDMLNCAFTSVAKLAVIPFQDVLKLDATHRMNTPGEEGGSNWCWRFNWDQLPVKLAESMYEKLSQYGRKN